MQRLFLDWLEVRAAVEIRVRVEERCEVAEIENSLSDGLNFNIYRSRDQQDLTELLDGMFRAIERLPREQLYTWLQ